MVSDMRPARFAEWIREVRESKGQTQVEAANEIGLSKQRVAQLEQGGGVTPANLFRIADWASVSVETLRPYFLN